MATPLRFFATTAKGTEGVLRDELRAMGLKRVRAERGGVWFEGKLEAGMRACLWSHVAMRIVAEVGEGEAKGEAGLYELARSIPWEDHLTAKSTFAVDATIKSSTITHSKYAALKVKDAIADRLTEALGARPDVDPKRPDVQVVLHLAQDRARLSIDLAGEPLHKRGWRVEAEEAPLRETLAAAVLFLGGFSEDRPFCDPMCGSGTIAIEAALVARRIAPGRGRHFGFHRWPSFGEEEATTWKLLLDEAKELALPKAPQPILARDRFKDPLETAARNADRAGVRASIEFEQRDARDLAPLPARCQLFTNPPYGERLGAKTLQLKGLFRQLGESFVALPKGHSLVALAGTPLLEQAFAELSLRPWLRHSLFNGPLEAKLLGYGVRPDKA